MTTVSKRKADIGFVIAAVGSALQILPQLLMDDVNTRSMLSLIAPIVVLVGCFIYVAGKGRSRWLGSLGVAGVVGFILLLVIVARLEKSK